MHSGTLLLRRSVVVLALAFGLVLMHGGIGQAMACPGMVDMTGAAMVPMDGRATSADDPSVAKRAGHHQPADQPSFGDGSQMCASTPAATGGGGAKAGAAVIHDILSPGPASGSAVTTIIRVSGREPPAPDLVSVLCVNRV